MGTGDHHLHPQSHLSPTSPRPSPIGALPKTNLSHHLAALRKNILKNTCFALCMFFTPSFSACHYNDFRRHWRARAAYMAWRGAWRERYWATWHFALSRFGGSERSRARSQTTIRQAGIIASQRQKDEGDHALQHLNARLFLLGVAKALLALAFALNLCLSALVFFLFSYISIFFWRQSSSRAAFVGARRRRPSLGGSRARRARNERTRRGICRVSLG